MSETCQLQRERETRREHVLGELERLVRSGMTQPDRTVAMVLLVIIQEDMRMTGLGLRGCFLAGRLWDV